MFALKKLCVLELNTRTYNAYLITLTNTLQKKKCSEIVFYSMYYGPHPPLPNANNQMLHFQKTRASTARAAVKGPSSTAVLNTMQRQLSMEC